MARNPDVIITSSVVNALDFYIVKNIYTESSMSVLLI